LLRANADVAPWLAALLAGCSSGSSSAWTGVAAAAVTLSVSVLCVLHAPSEFAACRLLPPQPTRSNLQVNILLPNPSRHFPWLLSRIHVAPGLPLLLQVVLLRLSSTLHLFDAPPPPARSLLPPSHHHRHITRCRASHCISFPAHFDTFQIPPRPLVSVRACLLAPCRLHVIDPVHPPATSFTRFWSSLRTLQVCMSTGSVGRRGRNAPVAQPEGASVFVSRCICGACVG
jgi:hypothetical protein